MSAKRLDGKALAETISLRLHEEVAAFRASGARAPQLVVVLVGDHAPSRIYVDHKVKACERVGIISRVLRFPEAISEKELLHKIEELNCDAAVDGILLQLPLPSHINEQAILPKIDPEKDVDGFHPLNMGRLALNIPHLSPATPKGIMMLLTHYIGDLTGIDAVVIGASHIVGRPMMLELLNHRATVTICQSKTRHLAHVAKRADLLIVGVGIAHFITEEFVKPGAIVVDVGINRTPQGKVEGDVAFEEVARKAAWISPVPGGVGPMTIAGLLSNTLRAFSLRRQNEG